MIITHGELKRFALNIKSSYRLHADCSIIQTVTMVTAALWTTARSGYERVRVCLSKRCRDVIHFHPLVKVGSSQFVFNMHIYRTLSDIGTNSEEHRNMRCFTWLEFT